MEMATLGMPADESTDNAPIGPTDPSMGMIALPEGEYRSIYAISPVFTVVGGKHSILPPRNVRGEVDENTLALTLSWDPPGGYEEVDLRYNIWWRSGGAWETVKTERARLDPAQFDSGGINRNHGYSEAGSAGSLSATTFDYGGVTYTVQTLLDQRSIADPTNEADLLLRLTPQPTAALDAALTLAFDNGDSVDLDGADRTDVAADTVNDVPAYSFYIWINEGIEFQEGLPVLFNFYDGNGNALIDSLTGVVVDGTTWTDDRSDRRYGVQAIDAEGRTSPRVSYVCSERTGCVIPGLALVKNTGQSVTGTNAFLNSSFAKNAQAFTTGPVGGYTLDSIGVSFRTIGNPSTAGSHLTVTVNVDNSGNPGNALCTLSDPTRFNSFAVNIFDAPTTGMAKCPTLAANTTYFVVIHRVTITTDAISMQLTASNGEDTGGVAGWSIGDVGLYLDSGSWVLDDSAYAYLIKVIGDPN